MMSTQPTEIWCEFTMPAVHRYGEGPPRPACRVLVNVQTIAYVLPEVMQVFRPDGWVATGTILVFDEQRMLTVSESYQDVVRMLTGASSRHPATAGEVTA